MAESDRERSTTGEYVETVTQGRVLDAVTAHPDPSVSAREVGERLGCSTDAARKKLAQLHERGEVARKKVGGRAVVWWRANDTTAQPDQPDRDPMDIISELETFLDDREAPSTPSVEAVQEDYHARRHRENLERLASDGE
jgi:predicted ArsR family transcriptional regulator